jgi:hypothetical protein
MSVPGFTGDVIGERLAQPCRLRSPSGSAPRAVIVPALYQEHYPCYSKADGSVGWCFVSCDSHGCVYGWD